jgi:hypothetical protein
MVDFHIHSEEAQEANVSNKELMPYMLLRSYLSEYKQN